MFSLLISLGIPGSDSMWPLVCITTGNRPASFAPLAPEHEFGRAGERTFWLLRLQLLFGSRARAEMTGICGRLGRTQPAVPKCPLSSHALWSPQTRTHCPPPGHTLEAIVAEGKEFPIAFSLRPVPAVETGLDASGNNENVHRDRMCDRAQNASKNSLSRRTDSLDFAMCCLYLARPFPL